MTMTRREFNRAILAAGLGASLALPLHPDNKSTVALARSGSLRRSGHDVKKSIVTGFLDRAMMTVTGAASPAAAWRSLFNPREKVGIKLSCLPGKPLSSSPGVVMAIVDGLRSAGVKAKNITIWERTRRELESAGFKPTRSGVHIIGTDQYSYGGYSRDIEISGSVGTCFSRVMEKVDALISVPVLKDHDIAGVSIGMKNFYGAIHNPNKFHGNRCDPYVADLCGHRFIKDKWRLTVCDATRVQVNNGPAFFPRYAWEYGGLLVSRDPVALDFMGWEIIEARRKELGMKPLKALDREPTYIHTAARLGLGAAYMKNIRYIKI